MKFSILALGAAVAGITTQCAAQIQIESSTPARSTQTRLVSQNQDFSGSAANAADESTTNNSPDYFSESAPQAEIANEADANIGPRSVLERPIAGEQAIPSGTKPVSTKAPLEVLALTPEVGMVPVAWQSTSGCVTPNPIANYMVRQWCVNGLWDTYPCERARQCAHIQQHIHGYNRYTGCCSPCATGTCGSVAVESPCASGGCAGGCAQNNANAAANSVSGLAAATPATASPFLGELQAGLPPIDMSQFPASQVQMTAYGSGNQMAAPAMPMLPSGQPVLQLPANVPTVPAGAYPTQAPSYQPVQPALPSLPVPSATPVVASRRSASFR